MSLNSTTTLDDCWTVEVWHRFYNVRVMIHIPRQKTAWRLVSYCSHPYTCRNMPETKGLISSSQDVMVVYSCLQMLQSFPRAALESYNSYNDWYPWWLCHSVLDSKSSAYFIESLHWVAIVLFWFGFFLLWRNFRVDYYVSAVLFLKFLCNDHSGQYHLSRKDGYSFHLIMIKFFFWLSICAFLKIPSS